MGKQQKNSRANRVNHRDVALKDYYVQVDRNKLTEWSKIKQFSKPEVPAYLIKNATPESFLTFLGKMRKSTDPNKYSNLDIKTIDLNVPLNPRPGAKSIIITRPRNHLSDTTKNKPAQAKQKLQEDLLPEESTNYQTTARAARVVTPTIEDLDDGQQFENRLLPIDSPTKKILREQERDLKVITPDSPEESLKENNSNAELNSQILNPEYRRNAILQGVAEGYDTVNTAKLLLSLSGNNVSDRSL